MKKLSIIIPVYGVEKYIEECMRSITCQIVPEVEVIIINDGTKDRSIEIAKKVILELPKELQECFMIFEQDNQGQSVARNHGISKSTGEFIAFVDPDDFVDIHYFQVLLKQISENPFVDVFHINAFEVNVNSSKLKEINISNNNEIVDVDEKVLINIFELDLWQPWLRVFNTKLKEKIVFTPNIILEDKFLFARLYDKDIKKIKNINENLVEYRIHSLSSLGNIKNIKKIMSSAKKGIEEYSNFDSLPMKIVFMSYLNLFISLNTNMEFSEMKKNSISVNKYCKIALNEKDISFWKRLKFKFPTCYAYLRCAIKKILKV